MTSDVSPLGRGGNARRTGPARRASLWSAPAPWSWSPSSTWSAFIHGGDSAWPGCQRPLRSSTARQSARISSARARSALASMRVLSSLQ